HEDAPPVARALLEQLGDAGEGQALDAVDKVVDDRVHGHGPLGVEGVVDVHGDELVELDARGHVELDPELEGPAPVVRQDDADALTAQRPRGYQTDGAAAGRRPRRGAGDVRAAGRRRAPGPRRAQRGARPRRAATRGSGVPGEAAAELALADDEPRGQTL